MTASTTARIAIEDLPPLETLTADELARIFGAGRASFRPNIEQLEGRELMAADLTATLTGGLLRIEGTAKADQIHIVENMGQLSVEGIAIRNGDANVASISTAAISKIFIDGLADDDQYWIGSSNQAMMPAVELAGSAGHDTLHVGGATFAVGLDDGVKQAMQIAGNVYTVDQAGALSLNGKPVSLGGFQLAGASLAVGDKGLTVLGFANVPVAGLVQFEGVVDDKGNFALKTNLLQPQTLLGGMVKLNGMEIALTNEGAELTAHADIASIGYADLKGTLKFDGSYKLEGKGGVKLGSLTYEAVDFTLGSADVEFAIPVPSIGNVSMRGSYTPDGQWFIQGTYPSPVTVGPMVLTNITVGIGNDRFTIGADASVANLDFVVDARIDGTIYFDGRFTLEGKAKAVNVGSFSLGKATVVLSNDPAVTKLSDRTVELTVDGYAGISFGPEVKLHGVLDSTGYYFLKGEDTFKIASLELQSTKFELEKGKGLKFAGSWNYGIYNATLGGEITSGGKVTFEGDASTAKIGDLDLGKVHLKGEAEKGQFSFASTTKVFSIAGFSLSSSTVTVTNRTPSGAIVSTITGSAGIPNGGPSINLSGTVDTAGNYDLSVVDTFAIAGLQMQKTTFTLKKGEGFKFEGSWNFFIFGATVKGSIASNGRVQFTGTDSSGSLGSFALGSIRVEGDLNLPARTYAVKFATTKDLGVAKVEFTGTAAGNTLGTWTTPTLTGRATAKGELGNILNTEAEFKLTAAGVTFSATIKLPYDAGSYSVKGAVFTDGSFEVQSLSLPGGLPGLDAIGDISAWATQQATSIASSANAALQSKIDSLTKQLNEGLKSVLNWKNDQIGNFLKQATDGINAVVKWKNDTIDGFIKQGNQGLSNALKWKNDTIDSYLDKANDAIDGLYTWASNGINNAWKSMNDNVTWANNTIKSWQGWLNSEYSRLDAWYNSAVGNLPGWARKLASYVNPIVDGFNRAWNSAVNQANTAIANLQASANSWITWYNGRVSYFVSERNTAVKSWQTWYRDKETWVFSEYKNSVKSWQNWYKDKETWALKEYNKSVKSWQDWYKQKETWAVGEYNKSVTSWQTWFKNAQQSAFDEAKRQLAPNNEKSLESQLFTKLSGVSTLKGLLAHASPAVKKQLQDYMNKIADNFATIILARAGEQIKMKVSR